MTETTPPHPAPDDAFVEDDSRETQFTYGDGKGPVALLFVRLAWIGFAIGAATYLYLYYFPDLAEWRAW